MNSWIKGKFSLKYLFVAVLILMLGFIVVEFTKKIQPVPYYQEQLEAAKLMKDCLTVIKEERLKKNLPIDLELDPNQTGIIGGEYTRLTTTLGNLSAKRTSTNPAFAALMVKYFKEITLKKGDTVAIGSSGSFPSLAIATLCAVKVLDLEPILIYSIGSSEYGATLPEYTFVQMLEDLNKKNLLLYQLSAISMGGFLDQAEGMFYPDSKETIYQIAYDSGVYFINIENVEENIKKRMAVYSEEAQGEPIKAFINIGGATPNYGNTPASITYPNGLVVKGPKIPDHPERGLIFEYQNLGIPVIHLLNIRDLAVKNGLPIDPVPLPEIGEGNVYSQISYQKSVIVLVLGVEFLYLFWIWKRNVYKKEKKLS